jgi:hypothetical protein
VNVSLIGDSVPVVFTAAFFAVTAFEAAFLAASFLTGAAGAFVAALGAAFLAAVFAEVGMFLLPVEVSVFSIRTLECARINAGFYKRDAPSWESFHVLNPFFQGFCSIHAD